MPQRYKRKKHCYIMIWEQLERSVKVEWLILSVFGLCQVISLSFFSISSSLPFSLFHLLLIQFTFLTQINTNTICILCSLSLSLSLFPPSISYSLYLSHSLSFYFLNLSLSPSLFLHRLYSSCIVFLVWLYAFALQSDGCTVDGMLHCLCWTRRRGMRKEKIFNEIEKLRGNLTKTKNQENNKWKREINSDMKMSVRS